MQTTAKHEDFHSLFVGFRNLETSSSPLSVPELEFDIINKLQIYRDRLKDDFKPTFPKYPDLELRYKEFLKKQLIHEIEKLINISSEELLAELFSDPDRTNIPKDTFKGYDLKTEVRVKKLFGLSLELENSCIKEIYDTVKPKFNFEGAIETIKRLYVNIAEKCPERSKDLDYALILIPISEIATLEQLVGEWLKAA